MQDYLTADIYALSKVCGDPDTAKLHVEVVHANYLAEVKNMTENDEDMAKESLEESQETAGFHEQPQRLALGGHFNHLFLYSTMRKDDEAPSAPSGKLLEAIDKHYSDFDGFKASFKKVVQSRVVPGWVWLGLTKGGDLVITQTNNEDNPLMGGIAEPQCTPVVGIDLWEHAYFSTFKGDKAAYCDAWFGNVNWGKVSGGFESHNLGGKVVPLL